MSSISKFEDLEIWQKGAFQNKKLFPLVSEWALRVQMLEDAVRIKTQRDARKKTAYSIEY